MSSKIKLKNNLNTEFSIEHKDNEQAISVSSIDISKVKSVNTIADLRALTQTPPTIWVSGYHTKGDGAFGSHVFEWDATSTEADNGGTIIKLDSITTGRYKLKYDGVVNVKWFGARGTDDSSDGIHFDYNDAPAIQNAIYEANNKQNQTASGTVFIPAGKYPIKETIETTIGLKIVGDGSTGLVSIDPYPSSGTALILAVHKPDNTDWTETTLKSGEVTIPYQVMFNHIGGVAQFEDIGAIIQNNDNSKSIFCLVGLDKNPYDQAGFSQGYFKRLRIFSFNKVFYGSNMGDCNFDSCGFEYNTDVFSVTSGYDTSNNERQGKFSGIRFSNCIFFGNYRDFITSGGTNYSGTFEGLLFSTCGFSAPASPNHLAFFNIGSDNSIVKKIDFSSCDFSGEGNNSGTKIFFVQASSPEISEINFSSCTFDSTSFHINYETPTGNFTNISLNSCSLDNTPIIIDYELNGYTICNNNLIDNSYIKLSSPHNGIISGNNFQKTSHSQTYDLEFVDITEHFTVFGNTLTSKGLNYHPSSSDFKIFGNLNVSDVAG